MWRSEGLPRNSDQQGRVCLLRTQHYSAPFCSRVPSTCHRGAACTRPVTGGHHALRGRTALPGDTADSTATPWALEPKASFCIALQLERVLWDGPHAPDLNVPRLRLEMLPHHQKHQEDQGHVFREHMVPPTRRNGHRGGPQCQGLQLTARPLHFQVPSGHPHFFDFRSRKPFNECHLMPLTKAGQPQISQAAHKFPPR